MNRRKFVFTSTISLLVITIAVAGLAFFSNFSVRAWIQELPSAILFLPADSQAVFGMNVQKFIASPVYAQFMEKHGQKVGTDLAEFIEKTGVDPRKDIRYLIAAGRPSQKKGAGVVVAVGTFHQDTITTFISSKVVPVRVDYKGATVLMVPEANGTVLEKGIAFLSAAEIALGDLESLHAILDVRAGSAPGIDPKSSLGAMLASLNPQEMFWFAGNPASILSKAPANAPFMPSVSAIQGIFGTLNLTNTVDMKTTVTAANEVAAGQLADFVRGLVALGNLAGSQNPDLAELVRNVRIAQRANQFDISVSFPIDLLQRLEDSKAQIVR